MSDKNEDILIEMSDIHKYFKNGDSIFEALKGINLTVKQGEFLGVLGPSGSGKSTLMNILGCMDRFDAGKYRLLGQDVNELTPAQQTVMRNRLIGFVFQKYFLIQKYTVLQNVMMPLLVRGVSHKEAEMLALKQLYMLDMEEKIYNKPNQLSGGQQQRTAIARALVGSPKILLADEPTGALDMNTGKEVLKLFENINKMGHTVIMITHDLNVASHTKRIVKINDGMLINQ